MKTRFPTLATAIAILGATLSPALADGRPQLVGSAGLTAAEAEGMTLDQIAAYKYNRGRSGTDRQTTVHYPEGSRPVPAGLAAAADVDADATTALSLSEVAASFFNRGGSRQDWQSVKASSRSVPPVYGAEIGQLAVGTGVPDETARSLTLTEIAALHFNRGGSQQDWQTVKRP
jgi:hypothetical protein